MFIRHQTCRLVLALLVAAASLGCALGSGQELRDSEALREPVPVIRPLKARLAGFGRMLRAYLAGVEQDIPIEIDLIHNDGLAKGLPTDVGICARQILEDIGAPIRTSRALPSFATPPSGASALPFLEPDLSKRAPTYRLVGGLGYASEVVDKGRNRRADAAGNGNTKLDAQLAGDEALGFTNITIQLTLEEPNGLAVPGATTTWKIFVERREKNRTASIYIAGSGIGSGSRVVVTQSAYDAVCDATAAAVIQLLGHALQVPYYRVDEATYGTDQLLDDRVLDSMRRLARQELEQSVKRLLFVQGVNVTLALPGLAQSDRVLVSQLMQQRSLAFDRRDAFVEYAFGLWKSLDYENGSARVQLRLAESVQQQRERALAAVPPPQPSLNAASFGWPASARVVILDLSRLPTIEVRKQIAAAARRCRGCDDMVINEGATRAILRVSSAPANVYEALRQSPLKLLQYNWVDDSQHQLVVAPVARSTSDPRKK